ISIEPLPGIGLAVSVMASKWFWAKIGEERERLEISVKTHALPRRERVITSFPDSQRSAWQARRWYRKRYGRTRRREGTKSTILVECSTCQSGIRRDRIRAQQARNRAPATAAIRQPAVGVKRGSG